MRLVRVYELNSLRQHPASRTTLGSLDVVGLFHAVPPVPATRPRQAMTLQNQRLNFHHLMASMLVPLIGLDLLLARVVYLNGFSQLWAKPFAIGILVAGFLYSRWRGFGRLQELAAMSIWALLLTNFLSILIQIAGRTRAPLVDFGLAHIDAMMHVQASVVVQWVHQFPTIRVGLLVCYLLLPLMILAAILVPTLQGRHEHAQCYLLAVIISAAMTAAMFASWPAIGPWTVYGFKATHDQSAAQAYLLLLKSGHPVTMNFAAAGVVSFPSYHAVLALLSAAALWHIRKLRWFNALLALVICVSTVTTGWHYVIDVVGGVAVAAAAQIFAIRLLAYVSTAPSMKPERIAVPRPAAAAPVSGAKFTEVRLSLTSYRR